MTGTGSTDMGQDPGGWTEHFIKPPGPGSLHVSTQPSWWWLHSQDRSKMDTDMTFTQDNIER